jgi:hypothetical protein
MVIVYTVKLIYTDYHGSILAERLNLNISGIFYATAIFIPDKNHASLLRQRALGSEGVRRLTIMFTHIPTIYF